ncbi:MAG: DNA methylase [Alphaproteobacteria bacterium]|nr:DNA methylase [Alphaproteobacteria bacterium]
MAPDFDSLPEAITAPRTDAIYNCHAYLTKVPVAAIRPFIETFSAPGETVVDFFAGSGMTGLAALTAGRKAVLSDISVLGQHIATGYLAKVSPAALRATADSVMKTARGALGELYNTKRASDGAVDELTRTVWSFTYKCPACAAQIVYYEHISPSGAPPKACPSCGGPFARRNWPRGEDVPVEVVVAGESGRLAPQDVSDFDRRMIAAAASDPRRKDVPSLAIEDHREMYSRSGLGKAGLTDTAQFFSPRNGIALLELWRAINAVDHEDIRRKLRFAFTAILPRASRRYQWSAKRPLNAQNQTYYIAPVYYEWNVFELFNRKVEAALRADQDLFGGGDAPLFRPAAARDVSYELASADALSHLKGASVDYVFTDPPFGSNIFYSDMSLFHEAWLGRTTDNEHEAVVHTTGRRKNGAAERYEELLRGAFSEAFRILKPGRYMSVVFGNSSGRIWGLVQRALRDAGFKAAPAHVAILDKGQRSVKGLNSGSEGVVTVDLILTVQKPARSESADNARPLSNGDTATLIREAVADLSSEDARNPSYVYAHILTKAIQKHLLLDDMHLGDVLVALRKAGYAIDRKTGSLRRQEASAEAA